MKAIRFKNDTDRDFTWKFDGIAYTFKAGQEIYLEDFKANHFAKHLIDRELMEKKVRTDNQVERNILTAKFLPGDDMTVEEAVDKNAREEVEDRKAVIRKGGKKLKSEKKVVEDEEEFAELNEK